MKCNHRLFITQLFKYIKTKTPNKNQLVVEIEEFTAVLKFSKVVTNALLTQFSLSLQPYYITIITVFSNNQATLL
jgi:hypothetical protein